MSKVILPIVCPPPFEYLSHTVESSQADGQGIILRLVIYLQLSLLVGEGSLGLDIGLNKCMLGLSNIRELSQGDAASCAMQEATNLDGTAFFGPLCLTSAFANERCSPAEFSQLCV